MSFYSIVMEPYGNPCENNHLRDFSCDGGVNKTVTHQRQGRVHLTSAVLDVNFGSKTTPQYSTCHSEDMRNWIDNKYTLKIKTKDGQSVLCHLHLNNNFQSNIDVMLSYGSTVTFSCDQTCKIHLNGNLIE